MSQMLGRQPMASATCHSIALRRTLALYYKGSFAMSGLRAVWSKALCTWHFFLGSLEGELPERAAACKPSFELLLILAPVLYER